MTEPTQEQIERIREAAIYQRHSISLTSSCVIDICNMALRTHDAEQRAQRAEALLRRARPILAGQQRVSWQLVDDMDAALATPPPPPEGEPNLDEYPSDLASMTRREYLESQGKTIDAPHTPEQAHGDALAALVDEIAPPIAPFNNEAEEEEYHCESAVRHYSERVRERLRRHLTASGVPGHWACKNPGRADQYRAEAMACRRALGFDAESHDVSPTDLTSAIADSGVPYIPEEVRRLPERMRSAAREMQAQEPKPGSRLSGRIDEAWVWADELEAALASAPAVPPVTQEMVDEINSREGWSGFTLDDLQMIRDAIAAAPTDGRE